MPLPEFVTRLIGDKKRWWAYKARTKQLPPPYLTAITGLERYLMSVGMTAGPGDADALMRMLDDLADLFEQSAADHIPVTEIVGGEPLTFAEEFLRNYGAGWMPKEQQRLVDAIRTAEQQQAADGEPGDRP